MAQLVAEESGSGGNMDEMARNAEIEAQNAAQGQKRKFVPASSGSQVAKASAPVDPANLGEIDIDDVMDDGQENKRRAVASTDGVGFNIAERAVPAAVFGALANKE